MRTPAAALAALLSSLLLAPCGCSRSEPVPTIAAAHAQELTPAPPAPPAERGLPAVASPAPDPAPSPEELAAFQAPVPK